MTDTGQVLLDIGIGKTQNVDTQFIQIGRPL
ncbi:hypothetical protein EVA_17808, partial [gut metagenome]